MVPEHKILGLTYLVGFSQEAPDFTNTNLKAVISYYVLTLDGGIFNHFGTQKERNLGLEKVTFSGKSLSPILKMALRGRPM